MRGLVVFLLVLLGMTTFARAETYVSVAPVTIDARDKEAPTAALVQELLIACLSQTPGIAVVERGDLNAVMGEKSAAMTGFVKNQGLVPRFYGVKYVITASAATLSNDWLVTLQANDPVSAQIVASQAITLGSRHLVDELCGQAARPLAAKLLAHPQDDARSLATESPDEAQDHTMLMNGIAYAKNGAWSQAFPLFLRILERDPQNADACYWLASSYHGAGLNDLARKQATECLAMHPDSARQQDLSSLLAPADKSGSALEGGAP